MIIFEKFIPVQLRTHQIFSKLGKIYFYLNQTQLKFSDQAEQKRLIQSAINKFNFRTKTSDYTPFWK